MTDAAGANLISASHVQTAAQSETAVAGVPLGVALVTTLAIAVGMKTWLQARFAGRLSASASPRSRLDVGLLFLLRSPLGAQHGRAHGDRWLRHGEAYPARDRGTPPREGVNWSPIHRIRRWALWCQPRSAVILTVLVVLATALATAAALRAPVRVRDIVVTTALAVMGLLAVELSRQRHRLRRLPGPVPQVNLTSVWTMAAALVLPAGWAAVAAMLIYAHLGLRRPECGDTLPPHRFVYRAAVVTLACVTAASVANLLGLRAHLATGHPGSLVAVTATIAVYSGLRTGLLTAERVVLGRARGPRSDFLLTHTALCVGALIALLQTTQPWTLPLLLPVVILLHRGVVLPHLERAATRDTKTGLLNPATWQRASEGELERARRHNTHLSVLMIDADHFKRINDTYGHLAGDRVLQTLASNIESEVRTKDLVGRFGGEEFVVALPGCGDSEATAVATRIRDRIRTLCVDADPDQVITNLSVSVGVATFPAVGATLDDLVRAADHAVFLAKSHGRDRVRVARRDSERATPQVTAAELALSGPLLATDFVPAVDPGERTAGELATVHGD